MPQATWKLCSMSALHTPSASFPSSSIEFASLFPSSLSSLAVDALLALLFSIKTLPSVFAFLKITVSYERICCLADQMYNLKVSKVKAAS